MAFKLILVRRIWSKLIKQLLGSNYGKVGAKFGMELRGATAPPQTFLKFSFFQNFVKTNVNL